MPTISAKDEFNKYADELLFMEKGIPHPDEVYKLHASIVDQKIFLRWDMAGKMPAIWGVPVRSKSKLAHRHSPYSRLDTQ